MPLQSSLSRLLLGPRVTSRSAAATSGTQNASSVAIRRIGCVISMLLVTRSKERSASAFARRAVSLARSHHGCCELNVAYIDSVTVPELAEPNVLDAPSA